MRQAPNSIWAIKSYDWEHGTFHRVEPPALHGRVKYVRADLAAAASEHRVALERIASMETPGANATVRRMAETARAAIAKAEGKA